MAISPMGIAGKYHADHRHEAEDEHDHAQQERVLDAQQGQRDVNQRGIDQRDYALGQKRLADEIAELFQAGKEIVEEESQVGCAPGCGPPHGGRENRP